MVWDDDCCACFSSVNFRVLKTKLSWIGGSGPVLHSPRAILFFAVSAANEIVEAIPVLVCPDSDDVQVVGVPTIEDPIAELLNLLMKWHLAGLPLVQGRISLKSRLVILLEVFLPAAHPF